MSQITVDQIENYVQKMLSTLSGDRGQTAADLSKLLAIIRGDIPICSPGVQPLEPPPSSAPRMTPTAATPKPKPAPEVPDSPEVAVEGDYEGEPAEEPAEEPETPSATGQAKYKKKK